MGLINANCPKCGNVTLAARDVTLAVWEPTDLQRYSFTCPDCNGTFGRDTSAGIVWLLVSAGVRIQSPPAEVFERSDGPALTHDDLLAFHNALHDVACAL